MAKLIENKELWNLPSTTMMGAMAQYITHADERYFQPMNANFGIMTLNKEVKKSERKEAYGKQALEVMKQWIEEHE